MSDMNNELGKILIYQTEKGDTKIDVYFEEDSIWMNQKTMAQLYQVDVRTINEHINNIVSEGELEENLTIRKFRIVQNEGTRQVSRDVKHYNLDMILAIGYRVRSNIGIHFRKWSSSILTEYMKKGFVLNDERLKNPKEFGADYFDELLERIRDIRASEKRIYQKVKEIFSLSVDYDSKAEIADNFFKSVQNKLEYASTGFTAPEIIAKRANATKNNMGLTNFKGAKVRKADITIAKNYMSKEEISTLNLIVNMYLDYAELQAKAHKEMYMADWENKLCDFLRFNGREVLDDFGSISRKIADKLANEKYQLYNEQRLKSKTDIDKLVIDAKKIKS